MPWPRGQAHHRAKLTDHEVGLVRELHEKYRLGYRQIARKFECSPWTIRDICKHWTRALPA